MAQRPSLIVHSRLSVSAPGDDSDDDSFTGFPGAHLALEETSASSEAAQSPCQSMLDHRPTPVHEGVSHLLANQEIADFLYWVQSVASGWEKIRKSFMSESTNPVSGDHFRNPRGDLRGITKTRWMDLLQTLGYKNSAGASEVFDEIANGPNVYDVSRDESQDDSPNSRNITLAQWKVFERRAIDVRDTLPPNEEQSPAARLCRALRRRRGTLLRAWRLDLDVRQTGRVAYVDFMAACRKLGFASEAKVIWSSVLKYKGTLLELHDLCPKEASNLEEFVERLCDYAGADLDTGWQSMDVDHQNFMAMEDFKLSLDALGFQGDWRLLFRGLDVAGNGRIRRNEFPYIGKVSRLFHRRGRQQMRAVAIADFGCWVKRQVALLGEVGSPDAMWESTLPGLFSASEPELEVDELARRMQSLGYDGDAMLVAELAKQEGNGLVSAESLEALLSPGAPFAPASPSSTSPLSARSSRRSPRSPSSPSTNSPAKQSFKEWDNSLHMASEENGKRCAGRRVYFTPLPRAKEEDRWSTGPSGASMRATPEKQPAARPEWNATPIMYATQHPRSRRGFDEPFAKPVRDEMRARVQRKKGLLAESAA